MLLAFCGLERISSKYQIKTFNSISEKGLKRFPSDKYVLSDDLSPSDAILLRSHALQSVEMEAGIIAVARAGAGVNNVPVEECSERGVVVFNTPGGNANSVKELVLTALLISARDIVGGISYVRSLTPNLGADELNQLVEKEKKLFKGHELKDKKLGVVGLGAIGSMVARAGLDMGMQVVGFDPALSVEAAWRVPSEVRRKNTLGELFGESDFVSLHVPLIEETRGLVDKEVLLAAKRGAVVLNFARDPIVDSEAILEALDNGAIGRYVSDFPVRELVGHDRVIFTPHLGASTSEAEENCAIMAADQLIDFLETGNITNSVNFPKVSMGTRRDVRLAVVNKNVPGMLGQITSLLAAKNVNVADLINKSREELAYNLIDIEQHPDDELLSGLRSLDNVMSVRVISD